MVGTSLKLVFIVFKTSILETIVLLWTSSINLTRNYHYTQGLLRLGEIRIRLRSV